MSLLRLAIATTDYDHFRDFRLGLVRAEGIDHNWLTLGHHEIFARFTFNRECYPRLEGARNTYTASQVWLAERYGPVTYCWSETANAPRTCIYTQEQCLQVPRRNGRGFCQPAGWFR
jgi:hypothetical protein